MKCLRNLGDLLSARLTFVFSAFPTFVPVMLVVVLLWWQGAAIASIAHRAWAAHVQATQPSPIGDGATATSKSHLAFGDTYTAIGTLFAGLAFAAVAWTLFRQHQQLNQARAREEFFQLLNIWQNATHVIKYADAQGNQGFLSAENELLGEYGREKGKPNSEPKFTDRKFLLGKAREKQEKGCLLEIDMIVELYKVFYEQYVGGSLAYIFRIQYQILKIIHSSGLPKAMRDDLAGIYRSMLSDPELHLLMYFALSSYAPKDYRELICQYELLDNLLFKEKDVIDDRIPEIQYFTKYAKWHKGLADGEVPEHQCNELLP